METTEFRPLYRQVRDMFLHNISNGSWQPGQLLPSEQTLAAELGVSHGTVRKALDSLASDNLVERQQGKGTFITAVTYEQSLSQFFRISRPGGERMIPECGVSTATLRQVRVNEARKLNLTDNDDVLEFVRTRSVDDFPVVLERIVVSAAKYPGLDTKPLPNAVYVHYQREYGINIVSVEEELRAISAGKQDAQQLGLAEGTPVLSIERLAFDLHGNPAEWRQSVCDTRHLVYAVTLR